jgi:hypothetical protein
MKSFQGTLGSSLSRWWGKLVGATTSAPPSPDQRIEKHEEGKAPRAVIRSCRKPRHLAIRVCEQQFDYSCVAACLQMIYEHFTGRRMSHRRAIRLTRCKPDGAEVKSIARIMRRLCGTNSTNLRTLDAVKAALRLERVMHFKICENKAVHGNYNQALRLGCHEKHSRPAGPKQAMRAMSPMRNGSFALPI